MRSQSVVDEGVLVDGMTQPTPASTGPHDEEELTGSNAHAVTDWRGFDAFPTWSPDGRWIVFASDRAASAEEQAGSV